VLLDGTANTGGSQSSDDHNYSCPYNPNSGIGCQAGAYRPIYFLGSQPNYFPQDSAYPNSTGKLSKVTVRVGLVGLDTTGTIKMHASAEEIGDPLHQSSPESNSIEISTLASSAHGSEYTEVTFVFAPDNTIDFSKYSILALMIVITGHDEFNDLIYDFARHEDNNPNYWLGLNAYWDRRNVPYVKIEDDVADENGHEDEGDSSSDLVASLSIIADPSTVVSGGSATISWITTNVTSCSVNDHDGTEGSFSTGILTYAVTYSGTCESPGGTVTDSVTVTVEEKPPPDSDDSNSEPSGLRPVVIIPGIMGSELYYDTDLIWPDVDELLFTWSIEQPSLQNLRLDRAGNSIRNILVGNIVKDIVIREGPIIISDTDTFRSLINILEDNNYVLNQNFFFFPYDWRLDLDRNNIYLKNKIQHIKDQTGFDKVDIIAHSMGGLVTEDYINQYGTQSVDKLIFVGTPHLGAPKALSGLLWGDLNIKFGALSKDRIKEIALNSPAIYELLPNPKYFDVYQGYVRTPGEILDFNQTQEFLANAGLNLGLIQRANGFFSQGLEDTNYGDIQVFNIVGCKRASLIDVFTIDKNFNGIGHTNSNGDGTVPFVSADYSEGSSYYVIGGVHNSLPSMNGVRQLIAGILTGHEVLSNNISTNSNRCPINGKELNWRSPVSVQIYDALGNHSGPLDNGTIENNIPNVTYDIVDGEAYIFLPTDAGEIYTIQGTGTDTGSFDLIISDIENDEVINNTLFDNVQIITGSSISFTVAQDSEDSHIDFDFDNDGDVADLPASGQFVDQVQALVQAVSIPEPPPSGGGNSGGSGGGGVVASPLPIPLIEEPAVSNPDENNGKILGETVNKLADGTLALDTADNRTVYMIGNGGKKYGFTSELAFRGLGFKFDLVAPADVSEHELGGFVTDPNQIHPNGSLISDGQTVWFVNYEKRFGFVSMEELRLSGFDEKQIVPANKNDMSLAETSLLNKN
jgi:pimeloyl-ACP methyl ester carboxylesterase